MGRASIFRLTLFLGTTAAFGQTTAPDSPVTQTLLSEIRQLRQDLQTTAATIQRVQIVMYRLQAEASLLYRATERLDNARAGCNHVQARRKMMTAQIEQAESRQRSSQNPSDRKAAEEVLHGLKSSVEMLASEEQQCQVEQVDTETRFRTEQAKMSDLQNQLDNLDRILAAYAGK